MAGPDQGSEAAAADDVPDGDGEQVGEKASQAQGGQVNPGLRRQLGIPGDARRHQSGGDVVHIGHTVLKAADDEEAHRHEGPDGPAGQALAAQGAHHPGAHQHVAQNPQHHSLAEGDGALGGGGADGVDRQSAAGQVQLAAVDDGRGQHQRPQQIADVDNHQIARHPGQGGLLLQQGDGNETVAGEQLRPGDNHHNQSEGEQQAAQHPGQSGVGEQVARRVGHHRSGSDKKSRQQGRKIQPFGAVGRFFRPHLGVKTDKFRRTQHNDSAFPIFLFRRGRSSAPAC